MNEADLEYTTPIEHSPKVTKVPIIDQNNYLLYGEMTSYGVEALGEGNLRPDSEHPNRTEQEWERRRRGFIEGCNLRPDEVLEFSRNIRGQLKRYKVEFSRPFIMEGLPAAIAYSRIKERYSLNDNDVVTDKRELLPTVVYRRESDLLWQAITEVQRLNGDSYSWRDLILPHEIQRYLSEKFVNQQDTSSIPIVSRLLPLRRSILGRDKRDICMQELAGYFFLNEKINKGINRREVKVMDPVSALKDLKSGKCKVEGEFRTGNSVYGDVQAVVVRSGEYIYTFYRSNHGIQVANIECADSELRWSRCINTRSLIGPKGDRSVIQNILTPRLYNLNNLGLTKIQAEKEGYSIIGGEYIVVPDNRTPEIAKEFRQAAERFFN